MNTCTVTGEADAKNRKVIRSALRSAYAPVLVTGCAINIDADFYADIDPRVRCEKDKGKIPELAEKLVADTAQSSQRAHADDALLVKLRAGNAGAFRTRVDLKVQDGCNNSCSFCIVHTARGPARSLPAAKVVEQVAELARGGTKELVLVGIDLAAYKDGKTDLAGLVAMLEELTDIGRIRISSVEPQSMTPSLISMLATSRGRLCRHLHLCLQSGSTKVLHEMNRHYSAEDFIALVDNLHANVPGIALSTDVIVGFPGETEEDFAESYRVIERAKFMRLHVFRYSKRPGTPAAMRADQIPAPVMAERSDALHKLGARLALEDMQRRIGTCERVIVERPGFGTSESYHAVSCDSRLEPGALVTLEFTDIDEKKRQLVGTDAS